MVTLRQIERHEGLNKYTNGAVRDSVKDIVGTQFRNTATVGGSIFGRYGFSDVLTVFMAMDTTVVCHKAGEIPLVEFAQMKPDRDILVKLVVKKKAIKIAYLAQRHSRTDLPILTCAVSLIDGKWSASVGGRPSRAVVVTDDTDLLAGEVTEDRAKAFGNYVAENLVFSSNMRGSASYRKQITPVLVKRAVMKAWREQ
jgi:CO/xanthine dehydrogenase FAD-binding subunit